MDLNFDKNNYCSKAEGKGCTWGNTLTSWSQLKHADKHYYYYYYYGWQENEEVLDTPIILFIKVIIITKLHITDDKRWGMKKKRKEKKNWKI